MKREELKALGLEEEAIDQIMKLHGQDVEKTKDDLATAETSVQTLTDQLAEANKTIGSFKEMDIEAIKQSAADYKIKFEQAQVDADVKLKALKFEHALEAALGDVGARNFKSVKALLDVEKLELADDGKTIKGLEEQLKPVIEENDYLFDLEEGEDENEEGDEDEAEEPEIVLGSNIKTVLGDATVDAARKAAGLATSEG